MRFTACALLLATVTCLTFEPTHRLDIPSEPTAAPVVKKPCAIPWVCSEVLAVIEKNIGPEQLLWRNQSVAEELKGFDHHNLRGLKATLLRIAFNVGTMVTEDIRIQSALDKVQGVYDTFEVAMRSTGVAQAFRRLSRSVYGLFTELQKRDQSHNDDLAALNFNLTTEMEFTTKPSWWGYTWKQNPFPNVTAAVLFVSRLQFDPVPDQVKDLRKAIELMRYEISHHPINYSSSLLADDATIWKVSIDEDVVKVFKDIQSFFKPTPTRTLQPKFITLVEGYRKKDTDVIVYACSDDCKQPLNLTGIAALAGPGLDLSKLPIVNLAKELQRKTLNDSWDVGFPAVYVVSRDPSAPTRSLPNGLK
jgi:hypothetical protein